MKIFLAQPVPDSVKAERIFNFVHLNAAEPYDLSYTLDAAQKIINLGKKSHDQNIVILGHFFMGSEYNGAQMLSDALRHLLQAVAMAEEKPDFDQTRLMQIYNITGIAYSQKDQHSKAILFFKKALTVSAKNNMRFQEAVFNNNIGIEFKETKQYDEARSHLFEAYRILKELKQDYLLPNVLINVGTSFFEENQIDSAVVYYRTTLKLIKQYPNNAVLATVSTNMAEYHLYKNNYDSSIYYSLAAMAHTDTLTNKILLRSVFSHLAKAYGRKGDIKNSILYIEKYARVLETLYSDEEIKKMNEAENLFHSYKERSERELRKKNQQIVNEQRRREKAIFWGMVAGSVILLIALYILYRRFREKKEANQLLVAQKNEIEEKKKEITDSITYAERIQSALLTPQEKINGYFPDNFILYLPRDIVSGDFYWADEVNGKKWIAVVDCTGHGVPGGFMSILSMNSLNRCVRELQLQTPAEVLTRLSDIIAESFASQKGQSIRDGMDIALCCVYQKNGTTVLEYAGANNPLWIVSRSESLQSLSHSSNEKLTKDVGQRDVGLYEVKADKRPVGFSENRTPFTNHVLELNTGDMFYLFSDGYADQFGGDKGKKYKYKKLQEFLLGICNLPVAQQHSKLKNEFIAWRGNLEQLDDVCVVAVEV